MEKSKLIEECRMSDRFRSAGILPAPENAARMAALWHWLSLYSAINHLSNKDARRFRATGVPPVLEHGRDGHGTAVVHLSAFRYYHSSLEKIGPVV